MRAFSIVGLLFAAVVLATIPVSPQVTSRGLELSVDQAQAVTYRRARVTARRVDRRVYRHTRRAVRRGVYSVSMLGADGKRRGRVGMRSQAREDASVIRREQGGGLRLCAVELRCGVARLNSPCYSPHPQVSHDFYGRAKDQRAKCCLRHRLHRALDQHAMDHASCDDDYRKRHMRDAPRSQSQSPAQRSQKRDGEDRPHRDHPEGGERRRRCEEKRVDHVRRTGDPEAGDVDHHRHHQRASDPAMCTPSTLGRQSRQISARQQGLNQHETQCEYPCESGHYVDRTAPCEQRARRRRGDRHAKGGCKGGPDQGRLANLIPLFPTRSGTMDSHISDRHCRA